MTTKVIIVADAAQADRAVHIHTERRDEHGHFVRADEPRIITGCGIFEAYVHDGQQIVVHEAERKPKTENNDRA